MLFIFDFDGTLVDTATDVVIAFQKAFQINDCVIPDAETIRGLIGEGLDEIVSRLLYYQNRRSEQLRISIKNSYKEIYKNMEKNNTRPFDGITDLLNELVLDGNLVAVNSNKPEDLLNEMLKIYFPNIRFAGVVGYSEKYPSKPDPYGVLILKEKTGEDSVVYIGDGLNDIQTARNANVPCIYVEWGPFVSKNANQHAIGCVKNIEELRRLIENYKKQR